MDARQKAGFPFGIAREALATHPFTASVAASNAPSLRALSVTHPTFPHCRFASRTCTHWRVFPIFTRILSNRILLAQALSEDLVLVTRDNDLARYGVR